MAAVRIRQAESTDREQVARMCAALWPESSAEEHATDLHSILDEQRSGTMPAAIFVSCDESGALTGFLEINLRSHADGCDPAQPVGFVEGWFVEEPCRNKGIGRALMRAAEDWARGQGCVEMASDTWIDNIGSQRAHEAMDFEVVDRCVHFRKQL
jgi:aminoglycoside 6'-N-acetyltransferase I